jgi:diguanylate cyclase (GGDEF)-like protein
MFERSPPADGPTVEVDGADVAFVVIDPLAGAVLYVNALAERIFDVTEDRPLRPEDILAELADLTPREFEAEIVRGSSALRVTVRIETLTPGAFNPGGAILVTIRGAGPGSALPRDASKRIERLEALWRLVVRRGFAGAEQVRAILGEAVRGIGMDSAVLARLDGAELVVEFVVDLPGIEPGAKISVERSPASEALLRAGTFAILDAQAEARGEGLAIPGRAFLSTAFHVDEDRWVLTFASAEPRAVPFDAEDWHYADNVVEALARSIERRESEARIEALAYSDTLTSLPNRMALLTRLDETIAEAGRLGTRAAVLFIDIDGFKAVNDTIGHRGGDAVLAEVAQRLRSTLRREEFIGRLGGDEFAIIMTHVAQRHQIESIAQRIGSVLTAPFAVDEHRFSLAASIGVAIYPDDATTREELLAVADAAMYKAKEQGGARIRFREGGWTSEAAVGGIAPSYLSTEPYEHGFLLAYQPVIDVKTQRVVAAEALVRRVHPVHGLLAPEHGWSIARDEPGRRDLDRWVLREATSQAHAWAMGGGEFSVDVNLAAYDPREIEVLFSDETATADLHRLRIEMSASQFQSQSPEFAAFVERCTTSGIAFVLDRFDGGFGSLQSLGHLPVKAIKLDRALVESVASNQTSRALIEGTVVVAKSLGWQVIAKGVETAMQQELLVSLGVDGVQGFYIAHPMTAIDFGLWLRQRESGGRSA